MTPRNTTKAIAYTTHKTLSFTKMHRQVPATFTAFSVEPEIWPGVAVLQIAQIAKRMAGGCSVSRGDHILYFIPLSLAHGHKERNHASKELYACRLSTLDFSMS